MAHRGEKHILGAHRLGDGAPRRRDLVVVTGLRADVGEHGDDRLLAACIETTRPHLDLMEVRLRPGRIPAA